MNMYMSSFLCFCFYENLQELNGVKMRMNIGRDEFLFLEKLEREGLVFILSKGRLITGELTLATMLINIKQIIEVR